MAEPPASNLRTPSRPQLRKRRRSSKRPGKKTECLFTRAESRDFIDVHALVAGGHYTPEQLLTLAASRDEGFDRAVFAEMLGAIRRFDHDEFRRYGLNDEQISS